MANKILYDEDYDILFLSKKESNEKVKKNFVFDDITISMTGNGKIVSIEINDASKYLGFDPSILNKSLDIDLLVKPKKDSIYIGFMIIGKSPIGQQNIPVANIPINCIN